MRKSIERPEAVGDARSVRFADVLHPAASSPSDTLEASPPAPTSQQRPASRRVQFGIHLAADHLQNLGGGELRDSDECSATSSASAPEVSAHVTTVIQASLRKFLERHQTRSVRTSVKKLVLLFLQWDRGST